MMIDGVDYSFARPGGAALAAAGESFAARYLYPGGKGLSASEVTDLHAHGISIPVVFEGAAGGMLGGFAQGVADARVAVAQLAADGLPALPVYFACDWNATSASDLAAVDAYLRGAASVLGANRVGVYGGITVIAHCQASGTAVWFWQTYAWSGGRVQPGIHLYQYQNGQTINGAAVDLDRAMQAEYGQHAGISPAGLAITPLLPQGAHIMADLTLIHVTTNPVNPSTIPVGVGAVFSFWNGGFQAESSMDVVNALSKATGIPLVDVTAEEAIVNLQRAAARAPQVPAATVDVKAFASALAPLLPGVDVTALEAHIDAALAALPASNSASVLAAIAALNTSDSNYLTQIEAILAKGFTITGTVK